MSEREFRLTIAERRHLLHLLHEDMDSGEYFGNRKQYYARTRRLIDKLVAAPVTASLRNEAGTQGDGDE